MPLLLFMKTAKSNSAYRLRPLNHILLTHLFAFCILSRTLAFKVALEALEHRAWACINGSAPPTPVRIYINVQHIPYNCPDIPPAALDCTEEAILPDSCRTHECHGHHKSH